MGNLFQGTSNEAYHADTTHLSSSALKLLLKDPAQFKHEYVDGYRRSISSTAFEEGTLTHALILEPHIIETEYAIYEGLRKAGKLFEEFVENNPNKRIISIAQMTRAERLFAAYSALPVATKLVSGGLSEHSMNGSIIGVPVKSRADYINVTDGYIVDVKTTSGPTDIEAFRASCLQYCYDLSAALYCDIAAQVYGKLFDFYFVVLSKTDWQCAVYKASSEFLTQGNVGVTTALVLYKKCLESGVWQLTQPRKDFSTADYEIEEV